MTVCSLGSLSIRTPLSNTAKVTSSFCCAYRQIVTDKPTVVGFHRPFPSYETQGRHTKRTLPPGLGLFDVLDYLARFASYFQTNSVQLDSTSSSASKDTLADGACIAVVVVASTSGDANQLLSYGSALSVFDRAITSNGLHFGCIAPLPNPKLSRHHFRSTRFAAVAMPWHSIASASLQWHAVMLLPRLLALNPLPVPPFGS
jgi:hypothetical protein